DTTVRMLGYNGSIPGPTLKVRQGSEVIVHVTNDGDLDTTVHWHGLRLENKYDGVPHETQTPIPIGGDFTYRIRFPDPGLYWYHPHIREDYTQEMGLYGNILVVPPDPGYWPPANRDVLLTLDDLLLEDGKIAPFSPTETTYTAMGRFGNVLLVSSEPATPSLAGQFQELRQAPELAAERQALDAWLAAPPDKTLALIAEMDDIAAPAQGAGSVVYACPMHPEVISDQPGRCPKCGMKLLVTALTT